MGVILFYIVTVTLVVAVDASLHWYLYRRLVRDPGLTGRLRSAVVFTLVLFAVLVPLNLAISRLFARTMLYPFIVTVWAWLGVAFYLATIFVSIDAVRIVTRWWKGRAAKAVASVETSPEMDGEMDRRVFVSRVLAGSAAVASAGVTTYGVVRANGDFNLPEIEVKLPRLPRALDGFRIALVSDIHIGPVLDGRFIDHIVETTNKLRPDLVCITGDLVDGSVEVIGPEVGRLARLKAKYGVAFSTGNHEYYSGVMSWLTFMDGLGFRVLGNRRVSIGDTGPGGASFDLAGIHDKQGIRFHDSLAPDIDLALAGRDPERELVLMAHQPSQIAMAEGKGVGLQLSGHTHGGQVWPFGVAARLNQPYLKGHHVHGDGTQIYVSCGTGYWGPPVRVGAPPEVVSIILTS